MSRTILVGDIHGCSHELDSLLDYVGFVRGDRLIAVGDLVVRGPDPCGTLAILRAVGARGVRGNHEDRLLRALTAAEKPASGRGGHAREKRREPMPLPLPLSESQRATFKALRRRDWSMLMDLPLWIDLPEHDIVVVHAGVVPGIPLDRQDPRSLMYMRCLTFDGEPVERRGDDLWGKYYEGPTHVVFGHNALREPQVHSFATGIDTGAVYGGRLTAMVLRDGERPPKAAERLDVLVSIPARKRYTDR